jgi:multicomponent Na+:H+ antiporter subunit G
MIELISEAVLYLSGIIAVIGALGLLRFPDFYTRTHAATIIGVGSFTLALLGVFIGTFWGEFSVKIIAIIIINMFANPTATHAIADAAYKIGIKPKGLVLNDLARAENSGRKKEGKK